jgi:hypothetical protein
MRMKRTGLSLKEVLVSRSTRYVVWILSRVLGLLDIARKPGTTSTAYGCRPQGPKMSGPGSRRNPVTFQLQGGST